MSGQFTRCLKVGFSLLYWCFLLAKRSLRSLSGHSHPGACIVLYYHAVSSRQRERFAKQLDMALRWLSPVAAGQRDSLPRGRNYFAITFDDALECVAENALPELQRRGIPSTIFVVSRSLGQSPIWMDGGHRTVDMFKVMSRESLQTHASDLVVIGSHSLTHPDLRLMDDAEARRQIGASRIELETLLHTPITLFSFPYGAFNDKLLRYCREAGYQRVFTTIPNLRVSVLPSL